MSEPGLDEARNLALLQIARSVGAVAEALVGFERALNSFEGTLADILRDLMETLEQRP